MRFRWTEENDSTLVRQWGEGAPVDVIADILGAPRAAVSARVGELRRRGYDLKFRRKRPPVSHHLPPGMSVSGFMSTLQAARFLGLGESTLKNHRLHGTGPRYYAIGRRILYKTEDLVSYVEDFAVEPTQKDE